MAFYNNCPRISFSLDFIDPQQQQPIELENSFKEALVSSDFEFSEFLHSNGTMISADELFFKGKMLPLKENSSKTETTLKDESVANDDDEEEEEVVEDNVNESTRLVKGTSRWKERLGLKRSHGRVVPKKGEIRNGLKGTDEMKSQEMVCEDHDFANFKRLGLNF